ncbi:type II toxin-antitoxin system HicB family antitoxin [Aurantimonas sp. A2-1-M11]|uniref:type II toxin-antitoxin system HicB family antitoxin n=1 Tax=Aurantimonas sp. A2-1-M11 TaxID=3113712 RepID=UPI002F92F941
MRDYRYLAELTDDPDGGVVVSFPDVPEAITSGADRHQALASAADALGLALRGYLAEDRDMPARAAEGTVMVSPHADDVLKLALIESLRRQSVTPDRFQDMSGLKDWEVAALFDPDAVNEVAALENALALLGQRIRIGVEAA